MLFMALFRDLSGPVRQSDYSYLPSVEGAVSPFTYKISYCVQRQVCSLVGIIRRCID